MAKCYGWPDEYIKNLSSDRFIEYYSAIQIMDAREKLSLLEIAVAPHQSNTSKASPKNVYKRYFKLANYEEHILTGKEAAEAIRRALGQ